MRFCAAVGCRTQIQPTAVFCDPHHAMLETDTQRSLARTWRPGRRQSKVFSAVLEFALRECLFYQTNGHRMPKPSAFEWDE